MKTYIKIIATIFFMSFASYANSQCKSFNPIYKDLMDCLTKNGGYWCQVTIVNAASNDRSHYYTAWGESSFNLSSVTIKGRNTCLLSTPESFSLAYSDRNYVVQSKTQSFSAKAIDEQVITLNLVSNQIISESKTWHFTKTYSNLVKKGNIIYGTSDGDMIILNLRCDPQVQ